MALALLGRGSLHILTIWGKNLGVRAYPEVVRYCKLPRPKRARAIWKSIYYVKWTKIENFPLKWQISSNNKRFFMHAYLQKKYCSFSFSRPKFSFGMPFRQFGIFPKSSCQLIVWAKLIFCDEHPTNGQMNTGHTDVLVEIVM